MRFLNVLIIAICFSAGGPGVASERPFSARDVMTYCMALSTDSARVVSVLEGDGWEIQGVTPEIFDVFSVAFMGTQYFSPFPMSGSPSSAADWKVGWPLAKEFVRRDYNSALDTVLLHNQTGSVLLISSRLRAMMNEMSCMIAIPESQLSGSSYFPKLPKPGPGVVSVVSAQALFPEAVRSRYVVISASIDPHAVASATGYTTDIGAAFYLRISQPAWVIEP